MNIFLYILSLIFIIILFAFFSLRYYSKNNQKIKYFENFVNLSNPDPTNVKDIQDVSDTDKLTILSEIYKNINNHEILISIFDDTYKADNIKLNSNIQLNDNIKNTFFVLKKQDNKIKDLLSGNYIPSKTLDKLIDGTIFTSLISDLKKIQNIPKTDDPELMDYQHLLYAQSIDPNNEDLKNKIKEKEQTKNINPVLIQKEQQQSYGNNDEFITEIRQKANQLKINSLAKKIENIPYLDNNPMISDNEINSRVENASLYYIVKIIEYHDFHLNNISEIHTNKFKKMYDIQV